jgi:ABC-type multidrug transport system fused ATPase/permease subunit
MRSLLAIVLKARASFVGRLELRLVVVVLMAVATGATAGVLPAVIGRAVGTVAQTSSGAPPSTVGRLLAQVMPTDAPWLVVVITLVATVFTVGVGVIAGRLGTALSGDVAAALRVEMMRAVLGASSRDVAEVSAELSAATSKRPPGMGPPAGKAPPGASPLGTGKSPGKTPPGKTPPRKVPPGARALVPKAPPGKAPPGKASPHASMVKLAVIREAAVASDFAVSVSTGLPQSVATLAVLSLELITGGAWLVLVGGAGLFVVSRLLADRASKRVAAARRALTQADAAVFGSLEETLDGAEDLRLWGAREQLTGEFADVARGAAAARAEFATALAVSGQIKRVFTAMAPLLLVVALGMSGRDFDAGEVATLLLMVPLLMIRLEALDGIRQGLIEREPVLEVTERLLALPPAPSRAERPATLDADTVAGHVRFENVTFAPPGAPRPVVAAVDLDVPAGSIVGICGPSGSGKSSLLRLLLRLDDPDEGRIFVDDVALDAIEPSQLPSLFGVVRQSGRLLQRRLRDNLALGLDPAPSDHAMRTALADVHLHALTSEGDDERGLDTVYRRHPPNFSGGEQRRLLMARMIVQNAPIRVLDEPEAGLPSATAEDILATLSERADGRTHLVVTHAPHLLASDFNVVLDAGRVVAIGSHDELRESCAQYQSLLSDALSTTPAPKGP